MLQITPLNLACEDRTLWSPVGVRRCLFSRLGNSPEISYLNHNPTRQRGIGVEQKNPSLTFRVVISGLRQNRKLFRDCSLGCAATRRPRLCRKTDPGKIAFLAGLECIRTFSLARRSTRRACEKNWYRHLPPGSPGPAGTLNWTE